jgi:hypothetical protein
MLLMRARTHKQQQRTCLADINCRMACPHVQAKATVHGSAVKTQITLDRTGQALIAALRCSSITLFHDADVQRNPFGPVS